MPGFDSIAPVYDTLAYVVFGTKLQRATTDLLRRLPTDTYHHPASVLVVGGGTGHLLDALLRKTSIGRIVYLEASASMLARASRRLIRLALPGTVEFRQGDMATLTPDEPFDVLLTPFVLDLFSDETLRNQLVPRLVNVLKPGGQWLVSDFVPTNVWWQQTLRWLMIRFFRLTTGIEARRLPDWPRHLAEAGMVRITQQPAVAGMVSAERWQRPSG